MDKFMLSHSKDLFRADEGSAAPEVGNVATNTIQNVPSHISKRTSKDTLKF